MDFTEKLVWQPAPFQSWGEKTDWIQEVRPEMPPFTFFIIFPYPNCRGELKWTTISEKDICDSFHTVNSTSKRCHWMVDLWRWTKGAGKPPGASRHHIFRCTALHHRQDRILRNLRGWKLRLRNNSRSYQWYDFSTKKVTYVDPNVDPYVPPHGPFEPQIFDRRRASPSMGLGEKEQTQLCCSVTRNMM